MDLYYYGRLFYVRIKVDMKYTPITSENKYKKKSEETTFDKNYLIINNFRN